MTIYKNCKGKKMDKCSKCNVDNIKYIYSELKWKRWCTQKKRVIKNYPNIPSWCPLEDWKDKLEV